MAIIRSLLFYFTFWVAFVPYCVWKHVFLLVLFGSNLTAASLQLFGVSRNMDVYAVTFAVLVFVASEVAFDLFRRSFPERARQVGECIYINAPCAGGRAVAFLVQALMRLLDRTSN